MDAVARQVRRSRAAAEPARLWRPRPFGVVTWIAVGIVVLGVVFWLGKRQAEAPAKQVAPPPTGLPHTPDYHALLVSRADPRRIVLGTHAGLYETSDGGHTWRRGPLGGKDAMNLVRTRSGRIWAAGHNVLYASDDGGRTWHDVSQPPGLPGLDLHGFAAGPNGVLYAAVAGKGLYRSIDGGRTFSVVSKRVGKGAYGLGVTAASRILAAEPRRGVLASDDGGASWRIVLDAKVIGLAVNPAHTQWVLAAGSGIFLSRDGGASWRKASSRATGPVAWASARPMVAYAVGLDRRLYRTADGGASWQPVP